jgi:putative CocE/NonD family hydrolase
MQTSRGTGGSGGEFHFWRNEAADGQATVAWLREQDWFTGELYTLGPSYNAYSQFTLAADPPPEWRGAVMQVGQTNPHDFFWPGGAFGLERSLVGGIALFGQTMTAWDYGLAILRLQRRLKHVLRAVPLFDVYPSAFGGRRPTFEEWLSSPEEDDLAWKGADLSDLADTFTVPSSLSTGWWDLVPDQVIEQFQRLRAAGCDVDLLIGSWTHTDSLEKGWAELFAQAMRRMRGEPAAYRVRAHIGGVNEWRDLDHWPPPGVREQRWHLGSGR